MREAVGQGEVGESVPVDPLVEETVARIERDVAVVAVDHRRHAVEAVAVEMELVEPVFDVRKQEVPHLFLAVIESFGVPVGLFARRTR